MSDKTTTSIARRSWAERRPNMSDLYPEPGRRLLLAINVDGKTPADVASALQDAAKTTKGFVFVDKLGSTFNEDDHDQYPIHVNGETVGWFTFSTRQFVALNSGHDAPAESVAASPQARAEPTPKAQTSAPPGRLEDLLRKYFHAGFRPYNQIDLFAGAASDSVVHPDKDGDAMFGGRTWELMHSAPTIRLLIPPDAHLADVLRGLRKVRKLIKRRPALLQWPAAGAVDQEDIPF